MKSETQNKLTVLIILSISAAMVVVPSFCYFTTRQQIIDSIEDQVEIEDSFNPGDSDYDLGYKIGYNSLLIQMGQNIKFKDVRYTSYSDPDRDSEESEKGYVDGYHRAADEVSRLLDCPGCLR
jgi:hypothetical protein